MIRSTITAVAMFAWLACGGGTPSSTTPATNGTQAGGSGSAAASAGPPIEVLSAATGDGLAAGGTAAAYVHAIANRDWPGVCATLLQAERKKLAARDGSCERGSEKQHAGEPAPAAGTTGTIRKRGDTIAVEIVARGGGQPVTTVFLQREDALWLVADLPAADRF